MNMIEGMKRAEEALMKLAKQDMFLSTTTTDNAGDKTQHSSVKLEIFDTWIDKTSVLPYFQKESDIKDQLEDERNIDKELKIHGVKVSSSSSENSSTSTTAPLVLLHGYANGAMYFYRNFQGLQKIFGTVYSLDLLGWGLSSRPLWNIKTSLPSIEKDSSCFSSCMSKDSTESKEATLVTNCESVFVESLEAWRKKEGIEKMILAGHSMGGYLSVAYCERYPHRVEHLILLSPVGVPEPPSKEEENEKYKDFPLRYKLIFGSFRFLWKNHVTPGSVVRLLGERGKRMVDSYVDRRIPAITSKEEKSILSEYLYLNTKLPPSGEFALNQILQPGAFARNPTLTRIPKLKVPHVSFLYGERDWMDPTGGLSVEQKCKELRESPVESETAPIIDVFSVKNAGHLLMLEAWEEFNEAMDKAYKSFSSKK